MIFPKNNKGQIMLLTVVVMGSIFLGAAAIGGLLTLYQVRQANDAALSGEAIFAADSGLEWQAFCYFVGQTGDVSCPPQPVALTNGASSTSAAVLNQSAKTLTVTGEGAAGLGSRRTFRILESIFTFR